MAAIVARSVPVRKPENPTRHRGLAPRRLPVFLQEIGGSSAYGQKGDAVRSLHLVVGIASMAEAS